MASAPRPTHAFSRRRLLWQLITALASLPFVGALVSMVRQRHRGRPPRRVRITPEFRDDVAFGDGIIVSRTTGAGLVALSASCTHLGCRITRVEDGLLVCPCHGSRFRRDGSVAAGPATRPLTTLAHSTEPSTGTLIVDVT